MALIRQSVSNTPCIGKQYYGYNNFKQVQLTLPELVQYIKGGYHWAGIYYPKDKLSKETFVSTHCIVLNVKSKQSMQDYIIKMKSEGLPLPTFAYMPVQPKDLYQYKLVYCFEDQIDFSIFDDLYNDLTEKVHYDQGQNNKAGNARVNRYCGCGDGYELWENLESTYKVVDFLNREETGLF